MSEKNIETTISESTVKVGKDSISIEKAKLNLTENAIMVLEKRYLKKDEHGTLQESPRDLFMRVAGNVAEIDKQYDKDADTVKTTDKFFDMMTNLDFLPNSPTLMNAGRQLQQLSACFVLPIDDSMESIFETVKNTAIVHKSGGGTGFSFSRLRPLNDYVSTTYGKSSGPISFMKVIDSATEAVNQGGFRRGANMGILRVDHPDIMDFIKCKDDTSVLTNFNISVTVTDTFMEAVKNDDMYDLINPRTGEPIQQLKAKEVFDLIVKQAWANGEPGIVFIDRINEYNPTPQIGELESTNPCGEQPLLPYEACNLGSINLNNYVIDKKIDYPRLKTTVQSAVHFLDNVIDASNFPLERISEMVRNNRKIGLGVMGFADMLIKLGIPYSSEEGVKTAKEIMKFIDETAKEASAATAEKRGAFPNFKGSIYDKGKNSRKVRNATVTTIAPTGSISIIAGCSSGVEPLFAVSYIRNVLDGSKLIEIHPLFKELAIKEGFYSQELMERVAEHGTVAHIDEIPQYIKDVFVTAHDITPEWHIKMQAAFQDHVDNAVSKTVNFPATATQEDVRNVYQLAYETRCKGVTIYRDGSRDAQVLSTKATSSKEETPSPSIEISKRKRPKQITGVTINMKTGCGPLYVTINEDENGFFELFNTMGKAGGCAASQAEAIGRLVSIAFRNRINPEDIIKQLIGIRCHKQCGLGPNKILSCADAIAKAIKERMQGINPEILANIESGADITHASGACPECGGVMEHEGGCAVCRACAYSECG